MEFAEIPLQLRYDQNGNQDGRRQQHLPALVALGFRWGASFCACLGDRGEDAGASAPHGDQQRDLKTPAIKAIARAFQRVCRHSGVSVVHRQSRVVRCFARPRPDKTVTGWMAHRWRSRVRDSQSTHWHQSSNALTISCTADTAISRHPVKYYEFPSCVGDFSDHQIGRDEVMAHRNSLLIGFVQRKHQRKATLASTTIVIRRTRRRGCAE